MRFPYQRSVGRDLQELFKYERLRAGAEPLGQSSIDEGSGSLDVRDGSGGTAAAIGDLPGGGVGIGIRWNGNLTDLASILQDLADEIASGGGGGNNDLWDSRQDRDIAGLRTRAGHIENTDTLQGQGIGKLGKRADTKDRQVFGLDRRVKGLEDRAADLGVGIAKVGRDTEQATKGLAEVKSRATKNSSDITGLSQKGDVLELWYEEAQRNRTEDRGLIDGLIEWFSELFADGGSLQSVADQSWRNQHEVTQARDGQDTLGKRIAGVDSTARGAASAASAAQSTATAAGTAAANAQSTANGAQSTATAAGTAAANAQSTANGAATAASNAQSSADQANDRITAARGSYGSLTLRLNAMDLATSGAASAATAAQSTANAAQTAAGNAQSGVNSLQNSIVPALVSAINNLRSRVAALDGGPGGPINP